MAEAEYGDPGTPTGPARWRLRQAIHANTLAVMALTVAQPPEPF